MSKNNFMSNAPKYIIIGSLLLLIIACYYLIDSTLRTQMPAQLIKCYEDSGQDGGRCNYCGDGTLNVEFEECDDGNKVNFDGCSNECLVQEIQKPSARDISNILVTGTKGEKANEVPENTNEAPVVNNRNVGFDISKGEIAPEIIVAPQKITTETKKAVAQPVKKITTETVATEQKTDKTALFVTDNEELLKTQQQEELHTAASVQTQKFIPYQPYFKNKELLLILLIFSLLLLTIISHVLIYSLNQKQTTIIQRALEGIRIKHKPLYPHKKRKIHSK